MRPSFPPACLRSRGQDQRNQHSQLAEHATTRHHHVNHAAHHDYSFASGLTLCLLLAQHHQITLPLCHVAEARAGFTRKKVTARFISVASLTPANSRNSKSCCRLGMCPSLSSTKGNKHQPEAMTIPRCKCTKLIQCGDVCCRAGISNEGQLRTKHLVPWAIGDNPEPFKPCCKLPRLLVLECWKCCILPRPLVLERLERCRSHGRLALKKFDS